MNKLIPLKNYTPPKYPTYEEAKGDRTLLKKLPSRWKKSVGALACVTLLGATALLGGCSAFRGCGTHMGGSGVPIYLVYLTEQEAISVIRNKAETMGLEIKDTPPNISVSVKFWEESDDSIDIGLDLFNEEKNIAFSYIREELGGWWLDSRSLAGKAKEVVANREDSLKVGFIHGTSRSFGTHPGIARRRGAEQEIKDHLTTQVREFIEWLQAEGIIQ